MHPVARFAVLLACAVATCRGPSIAAATVTLGPTADAAASSANPANNYGGAGSFAVSAAGLPKGEFQALLQFDLSSAKANFDATFGAGQWTLTSASLQLTAANPNNPLFNGSAAGHIEASWLLNDGWTEGTGTPNSPGAAGVAWNSLASLISPSDQVLGSLNFSGATSGAAMIPLAATSGLAADAATGSLLSLRLYAPAGEAAVSGLFNSRSFGTVASRPELTLNAAAVPEPATAGLAVIGLCGLLRRFGRARQSPREVHHD
ncbi:MAG: hypothetical protein IT424_09385 [Pirellulales bacterium]|nr:hypothetical protein [Pirellulales bacterium]